MFLYHSHTTYSWKCSYQFIFNLTELGLPGVVFILPDSYIDPVNKEYGGLYNFLTYLFSIWLRRMHE